MGRKILFIISSMNYGGAQKMLSFLANSFRNMGNEIIIYAYSGGECHFSLNDGVEFICGKKHNNFFLKRIMPIFEVRRTIKMIKPDIVISFLNNGNFLSIIGTAHSGIPVIISERSDPYNENSFSLSIMRFFYRFADGAVFQTDGAKSYYNNKVQTKSVVIPNPVTIKSEERIPFSERNDEIAFVARFFVKQKRQDIMIEAFKKVIEKNQNIKLVFYGDGPDMPFIKQLVDKYNLTNFVTFAGKVSDVKSFLKKSKLFVLTSDYEGIPNALIEAMAVGLPVISTDCSPGGARLLIENNVNGILVPRGGTDEIANAILYLLDNPDVAEQYGMEAQKIIQKFEPEKIVSVWRDYIERILMK